MKKITIKYKVKKESANKGHVRVSAMYCFKACTYNAN